MIRDWNDLKYVLALAETGTLSRAAERLKTNPTTVSRHIKRLSTDAKQVLFQANKDGKWQATAYGDIIAEVAKGCSNQIETLLSWQGNSAKRHLKISTVEYICECFLIPNLNTLETFATATSVEIESDDQAVSLAYGEADLSIRLSRPTSGRLIGGLLGTIQHSVYAPCHANLTDWIGLSTKHDQRPEMVHGRTAFGKGPAIRLGTFKAIREAGLKMGLPFVAPDILIKDDPRFSRIDSLGTSQREVWSVIHESRRSDEQIGRLRDWAKSCFSGRADATHTLA